MSYFAHDQLDKIVSESLAKVPDGHKNAMIGTINNNGAQFVVGFKLGDKDQWQVTGVIEHSWSGNNTFGADVIYSW